MGQQQLLLLVLATVIVGLATVAGIQAFNENQQQAAQDALVQRGTDIASDIKGAISKPTELGGADLKGTTVDGGGTILKQLGYEGGGDGTVPVEGAPGTANCTVTTSSGSGSSDLGKASIECDAVEAGQKVTVTLNPDASGNQITTSFAASTLT